MTRFFPILLLFVTLAGSLSAADKKPNVLLLMSDDLSTALSGFGHPQCKTPNLDALAERGMKFENMHCQYPVCGSSRASMMTGLYPYTNGMLGNSGVLRNNLPDVVTLSQLFRQNGYHVGRVSKIYHMGIPTEIIDGTALHDDPESWDEVVNIKAPEQHAPGTLTQWSPADTSSQTFAGVEATTGDFEHADGMAANAAVEFLKQHHEKPFFLACGFVRPHVPLVAPEKYFDPYDRSAMILPSVPEGDLDDVPGIINSYKRTDRYGFTPELHRGMLQAYYASVSYMDAMAGKVIDALAEYGVDDNTIVIFTSDHGYMLGEHNKFQKQHLFEESTRVPFILRAPQLDGAHGKATTQITELVDVYPTVAELAGLAPPVNLQGRSMTTLLENPESSDWSRSDAFTISRSGGESLRTKDWRFTQWGHGKKGLELYDRANDPREFTNLAKDPAYQSRLQMMKIRLEARRVAAGYDPEKFSTKK